MDDDSEDDPGATDDVGAMDDEPCLMEEEPGAADEEPDSDDEPGASDDEPGASDDEPGASDVEPGASDDQPGASDDDPGATGDDPGAEDPEPPEPEEPDAKAVFKFLKLQAAGSTEEAEDLFRDAMAECPDSGLLMELGIKEGILEVDVAMEVGAHYSLKFAELTGFGLIGAANACLREGLKVHPESPLLLMLKTRLLEGGTRGAALWRFEEARMVRLVEEARLREAAEKAAKQERRAERARQRRVPPALPQGRIQPSSAPAEKVTRSGANQAGRCASQAGAFMHVRC